jgi:putative membrane protein
MGAADIVPGVSGGTVALVLGIYRQLLDAVRGGARTLRSAASADLRGALGHLRGISWAFILPLLAGIAAAFLLLRHPMRDLLHERPEGVAAVFCGLVAASVWLVWRRIPDRDRLRWAAAAVTAGATFVLLGARAGEISEPPLWGFALTGAVAVCAMILPGISGSFIMLMAGMYAAVLGGAPLELAVFAVGAVLGLAAFSSVLGWALDHHAATVTAVLVGLMVGSIRVLWPWPNGVGYTDGDVVVSGTELGWPGLQAAAGGAALAVLAFAATMGIAYVGEAKSGQPAVAVGRSSGRDASDPSGPAPGGSTSRR